VSCYKEYYIFDVKFTNLEIQRESYLLFYFRVNEFHVNDIIFYKNKIIHLFSKNFAN